MSFSVRLVADTFSVEPGSSAAIAIEIQNLGAETVPFELSIEGVGADWVAIPVPSFKVDGGETVVERFFIKPPRDSESKAGDYPFVVRVRSLDSGDSKTVQGAFTIAAYHHLSVDVTPRKSSVSPSNKQSVLEVTVMNLGNVEQTLGVYANDVDDEFAYEFSEGEFKLGPSQQKNVELTVEPTQTSFVSGSQLSVVTVSTRNLQNPSVNASAQAHIEQKPMLSPGSLIAILSVLILGILWVVTLPKPPQIDSFSLNKQEIMLGETVTISWNAKNAQSVELKIGEDVLSKLSPIGNTEYRPDEGGEVEISLTAVSGNKKTDSEVKKIIVTVPEKAEDPVIRVLSTKLEKIPVGTSFIINYDLSSSVTYAWLEPFGQINPTSSSQQLRAPNSERTITYTLIARNKDGKETKKSITIEFVKVTLARIVQFVADPMEFDPLDGRVTLRWQLANCIRAEIRYGGQSGEIDPVTGKMDILLTEDAEITLVAYDQEGLETTQVLTVKVKKEPEITPPTTDDGATTGTTGTTVGVPPH